MYKVIEGFHDLTDFKETKDGKIYHEYKVGDEYPRVGAETTEERLAELSGSDNLRGAPLIKEVKSKKTGGRKAAE